MNLKVIIEALTEETLLKKAQAYTSPEEIRMRHAAFRRMVEKQVSDIMLTDPMLRPKAEGNRIKKGQFRDTGDGYLAFAYSKKDTRTNEKRLMDAIKMLKDALGVTVSRGPGQSNPSKRASKTNPKKWGGAEIKEPVWYVDLFFGLNQLYQDIPEFKGYAFTLQINAAATEINISIRYSDAAI